MTKILIQDYLMTNLINVYNHLLERNHIYVREQTKVGFRVPKRNQEVINFPERVPERKQEVEIWRNGNRNRNQERNQ